LSFHNKVDTTRTPIKAFDKGKGFASQPTKWLEEKKMLQVSWLWTFPSELSQPKNPHHQKGRGNSSSRRRS